MDRRRRKRRKHIQSAVLDLKDGASILYDMQVSTSSSSSEAKAEAEAESICAWGKQVPHISNGGRNSITYSDPMLNPANIYREFGYEIGNAIVEGT